MSKTRKKKSPKRALALPDLEQAKSAVLAPDVNRGLDPISETPSA
jgi:hypothetical protein